MDTPGRTVMITGATRGLGWEFADIFAGLGYELFLTGRDEARLEQFRREHGDTRMDTAAADLSAPGGVEALLESLRRSGRTVEILVNNAGFGDRRAFSESDAGRQAAMIQVNIASLVGLTRALLPGMLERGTGRILNVGSNAGFVAGPLMAVYYASKAFVLSFSYALAEELRGSGVTVTVLCPGSTDTDFDKTASARSGRAARTDLMDARRVAEAGVRALSEGKRMSAPGFSSKSVLVLSRLAPRAMVARAAGRRNARIMRLPPE